MDHKRRNIIGRLSALTTGILIAAQSFTAFAEAPTICGDVNCDGKIDVSDVVAVAAHVKSVKTLDGRGAFIADVNNDGIVNVSDIAMIAAQCKGIKAMPRVNKPEFKKLDSVTGETLQKVAHGKMVTLSVTSDPDYSNRVYKVKVTDIETEETERVITFNSNMKVAGIKEDGTVIIAQFKNEGGTDICFYHPGEEEPEVVETDLSYPDPVYDEETDTVYLSGDGLYKLTSDKKLEKVTIAPENDFTSTSYDFMNKVVGVKTQSKENPLLKDLSVVSLQTGETCWKTLQSDGSVRFSDGYTLVTDVFTDEDGNCETSLRCFDTKTGEKLGVYKLNEYDPVVLSSNKSGKFIFNDRSYSLAVLDPRNGGIAYVDMGLKNMGLINVAFLDEDKVLLSAVYADDKGSRYDIFMLDTSKLEYTTLPEGVDVETSEEFKPKTLGEELKEQRKKADRLEDEYGVTILIGDEVMNIPRDNDWYSDEEFMDPEYPEYLDMTLDELEGWLMTYPEDFFDKFKSEENPGGLRLEVIRDFCDNDTNERSVAGRTFKSSADYIDIAVRDGDVSNSTLDHETWHAVEMLVGQKTPFDDEGWDKLNPEGFEYYPGDYFAGDTPKGEMYEKYLTDNEFGDPNYENAYFARNYSEWNPREDRATIVEFLCPSDAQAGFYEMDEEIVKYTHIKAKLDYMGEWIRPYFGYVYWEEMIKNKYVPEPGQPMG